MTMNEAFTLLGLTISSSIPQVKKRYWQLARTHHPDNGGSVEKMKDVNEAYRLVKEHVRARAASALYRRKLVRPGTASFFVSHTKQDFEV
jgi:curved DNA-binding protein CbpA